MDLDRQEGALDELWRSFAYFMISDQLAEEFSGPSETPQSNAVAVSSRKDNDCPLKQRVPPLSKYGGALPPALSEPCTKAH